MTEQTLNDEQSYQVIMLQAEKLLVEGFITEKVFQKFKEEMLKRYDPFISQLVD